MRKRKVIYWNPELKYPAIVLHVDRKGNVLMPAAMADLFMKTVELERL